MGLVAGLDYHDPSFDPQVTLQRYKTHPLLRRILEAGGDGTSVVRFGDHLQGKGQSFYESACEYGLECLIRLVLSGNCRQKE